MFLRLIFQIVKMKVFKWSLLFRKKKYHKVINLKYHQKKNK